MATYFEYTMYLSAPHICMRWKAVQYVPYLRKSHTMPASAAYYGCRKRTEEGSKQL
ncbi:hypothetical protein BIFANG_03766 [Bifidobacterium angulatum DSM 20098 = JCM 7096]|uniref:Uncharacterized protein n=1 Tax=Bifidobacterium angulatum DSM 20098 = JCM 7096 TaxID=518635 RepID=C4FHD0_9BIFI|nr:hypothetical protein BIFANG_03766 [Bifidobacterium angulatum DSM 20098 = JCM 7096]BAQ95947.1 hypothetical protein BBAG_0325 [Bifidobacterium angulatum DSM 20098 = JCM 7096]